MADSAQLTVRGARPPDYDWIVAVMDDWWGRSVSQVLPRLFLEHFSSTSFVAEDESGALGGFLVGFVSADKKDTAYVHFLGVRPDLRSHGLGRLLYEHFFALVRSRGVNEVLAITPPVNTSSMEFHYRLGFSVSEPVPDYHGPGRDRVVFRRALA